MPTSIRRGRMELDRLLLSFSLSASAKNALIGVVLCSLLLSVFSHTALGSICPNSDGTFFCSPPQIGWGGFGPGTISSLDYSSYQAACQATFAENGSNSVFSRAILWGDGDEGPYQYQCIGEPFTWTFVGRYARCPLDRDWYWTRMYPGYTYPWPLPPSQMRFFLALTNREFTCWRHVSSPDPDKNVDPQACAMRTDNPIHVGLGIKMQEERDYQDRAGFLLFERSCASELIVSKR